MKKQLTFLVYIVFQLNLIYGGGWTCQRFKLEINTANETITGYIELGDKFRDCKENEILNYINENYKPPYDTITLYDTIYNLNYPTMRGYKLTAILKQDISKVAVADIKNINFINKSTCQEWTEKRDTNNYEHYYAWIGHTTPIPELTLNEIELLQTKPIFQKSFVDPLSIYSGYYVISYADNISKEKIDSIIEKFNDIIKNYTDDISKYKFLTKEYLKLKNELRKKKIIIFKIEGVA